MTPKHLRMGPGAQIRHFTVNRIVRRLEMGERATIGKLNLITTPKDVPDVPLGERGPDLLMAPHST